MDRTINNTGRRKRQHIAVALAAVVALVAAWQGSVHVGGPRLKVDTSQMIISTVEKGVFREYFTFDGRVEPAVSVYLDIEEGGRVEAIVAEGGQPVTQGDLILRFSNSQVQRTGIETETRLLEALDAYRSTELSSSQSALLRQEALLELDHQITELAARFARYEALMKGPNSPISRELHETTRDQLQYLQSRRKLMQERMAQEELLTNRRLELATESIARLNEGRNLLSQMLEGLEVRAPISGHLSSIDAQVGQNIGRGERIGQIDVPDRYKISASIDQYYIARVQVGTTGHVRVDGRDWDVRVQKVYPEVRDSLFKADLLFTGPVPATLKRGQAVNVELSFGSPRESLHVARGGFYQHTGGRWAYRLAPDGRSARRVDVVLGRQNPRQVEVLEGLQQGDRIITSSYESYNEIQQLKFDRAITNTGEPP